MSTISKSDFPVVDDRFEEASDSDSDTLKDLKRMVIANYFTSGEASELTLCAPSLQGE